MKTKVCKFGGSSLCSAEMFRRVADIISSDPSRRFVVPSAPGKRHSSDQKVTDLLLSAKDNQAAWQEVRGRFEKLADDLGLSGFLDRQLIASEARIRTCISTDYAASRGEFLNGLLLAEFLGFKFVDAADVISFDPQGQFDPVSYRSVRESCGHGEKGYVIPGFYGQAHDGTIKTFSRGGSDITGAIVANAMDATVYENWTDVDGIMSADPRLVNDPVVIADLTYRELRELTYAGASVFHDEAVKPVWDKGIPIHIRNTNNPSGMGTWIVETRNTGSQTAVGIAGRKGFVVLNITSQYMHNETGVAAMVLETIRDLGISIEHVPTAIDEMSVIMSALSDDQKKKLVKSLSQQMPQATLNYSNSLALVATVGLGMAKHPGTAAKLFSALAGDDINIRVILQGASENNIIVGIDDDALPRAVQSIYNAFFKEVPI